MEELQPEELEDLVQELQEESDEEEALVPEVEELLRDLQPDSHFAVRKKATEQLGSLGTSHQRIVSALIAVQAFDKNHLIRTLAAESLRAPAHQQILQEHPDLIQRARSAAEQAAIQRERQREEQKEKRGALAAREVHNRKEPKVAGWIYVFIPFGIVWMVVSGIATAQSQWDFWCFPLLALPGVGVVALALWRWRSATINREVLDRTAKETVGKIENKRKKVHEGDYGSSTTYHVTVCFEAEDARIGTRVMVLKAQVAHRVWKGLRVGQSIGIRYAAEDPRIALIEGEW